MEKNQKNQISKIIVRKGQASELPGAPTSLSPLTFPKGLDSGEMAFASDMGRLYIGHDPSTGQPQFNRTTFPYRNIEVLTENSADTLETMVGSALKDNNERSFHYATLPTHSTDWENVVVPRSGDASYGYRLPYGDCVSATMDYTVFDAQNRPVKTGFVVVRYFDGEGEPSIVDEHSSRRRLDLLEPDASNPDKAFAHVSFRFVVAGPLGGRYLSFQYKNHTDVVLNLRFKTSRPKV